MSTTKKTKVDWKANASLLESENTQLKRQLKLITQQNDVAAKASSEALNGLASLELKVIQSPRLQKILSTGSGNISFWWVVLNSSLVKDIIEYIVAVVKQVAQTIREARDKADEFKKEFEELKNEQN